MQVILSFVMTALAAIDGVPAQVAAPQAVTRPGAGIEQWPHGRLRDSRYPGGEPWVAGKADGADAPVSRQEACAVWSLDAAALRELLEICQADTRSQVLLAPKMTTRLGDPARMTSEETVQYVASLKRVADGPPNKSTRLAFEPEVDKVHSGVRVNIPTSQLKGQKLFAKIVIEENRLLAMHTVKYTETVQPQPGTDPEVTQTSFLERLNPNRAPHAAAINATIQVPEVDSRRVEGEWMIPSDGALLVSLGPRAVHERGFLKGHEEHLIAITAHPLTGQAATQPLPASAQPSPAAGQSAPTGVQPPVLKPPLITPSVPAGVSASQPR